MADLDSLLVDLESSIEHRDTASVLQQHRQFSSFVNYQKDVQGVTSPRHSKDPRLVRTIHT